MAVTAVAGDVAVDVSAVVAVGLHLRLRLRLRLVVGVRVELYLELSRSWHMQGGIVTLLACAGGNCHALGIEPGMHHNSIDFDNHFYTFYQCDPHNFGTVVIARLRSIGPRKNIAVFLRKSS